MRCLFIAWNDGAPASQFTVPDDYHLPLELNDTVTPPEALTVFDDDAGTELYLQTGLIRSAYLRDLSPAMTAPWVPA
jgi:hypothetical protein